MIVSNRIKSIENSTSQDVPEGKFLSSYASKLVK